MIAKDEALHWYRLFCVPGLGPKRLHSIHNALIASGMSTSELFHLDGLSLQQLLPMLPSSLRAAIRAAASEQASLEYERLLERDVHVLHLGHPLYPRLLVSRMGDTAPPLLFCVGNTRLLDSEGIAIVGARNASDASLAFASRWAADLALQGKNVISGYAKGIDMAAHLGALAQGGTTAMVLSSGIYEFSLMNEFRHVEWKRDVLAVSQFDPSTKWAARNAMVRNRLVSGLARAMVVIEAGPERDESGRMSGTFDAGKVALEMGVKLFVLSPKVLEHQAPGNASLISMGGTAIRPENALHTILRGMNHEGRSARCHHPESKQGRLF